MLDDVESGTVAVSATSQIRDELDAEIARRESPDYHWAPRHSLGYRSAGRAMQLGELTGLKLARSFWGQIDVERLARVLHGFDCGIPEFRLIGWDALTGDHRLVFDREVHLREAEVIAREYRALAARESASRS